MSDTKNPRLLWFKGDWYAIGFWMTLLFAPLVYWFVRSTLSTESRMPRTHYYSIELALAAAWLGLLSFWIARGSHPLPWRCLIGFAAGMYTILLFSCDVSVKELLALQKVPCDLRLLADGLSFFLLSFVIQMLIAMRDHERLHDRLSAISRSGERQVSIRFLLCVMTASVFAMLFFSRTYSWGFEATVNPLSVARSGLAAIPSALLTYLTARMTFRLKLQSYSGTYQMIVWCILFGPVLLLGTTTGGRYFENYLVNCLAFLTYWCVTYFVMITLRRSKVVLRSRSTE